MIGAGAGVAFAAGCRGGAPPQDEGGAGVEDTRTADRRAAMPSIALGDIEISSVVETDMIMTPTSLIPDAGDEEMARHREWLAPRYVNDAGDLLVTIRTYVVRTAQHTW